MKLNYKKWNEFKALLLEHQIAVRERVLFVWNKIKVLYIRGKTTYGKIKNAVKQFVLAKQHLFTKFIQANHRRINNIIISLELVAYASHETIKFTLLLSALLLSLILQASQK